MTTPMSSNRISQVDFEKGFTGDGKIFIHIEKQENNSEKLVIYEATNSLSAFFLNLFRNPNKTFTAREWAARSEGKLPANIDKEKLIQNIKQVVSPNYVESAPLIFDKLVQEKKLDAAGEVSACIQDIPLGKTACAQKIQASLMELNQVVVKFARNTPADAAKGKIVGDFRRSLTDEQFSNFTIYAIKLSLSDNLSRMTEALLSHIYRGEEDTSLTKQQQQEQQLIIDAIIAMESKSETEQPPLEQKRYLLALKWINENLKKQSDPALVTNPT